MRQGTRVVTTLARASSGFVALLLGALTAGALVGCSGTGARDQTSADSAREGARTGAADEHTARVLPADSVMWSLAFSAGGDGTQYRANRDTTLLHGGAILGRVRTTHAVVGDTVIEPTHDLTVCKPFTETQIPADKDGVGNAVVWLVGVETGPEVTTPRRVTLWLDRCRLEPRVQSVVQGSTLLVTSRDPMMSRLRFSDMWGTLAMRAQIALNDAGQVVPTTDVAARAGLVAVQDDMHPWIRAWIAVSTHPFVFVTDPDGAFRFANVPEGSYTMVVWQEKLGVRTRRVQVTRGVETRVQVEY